MSRLVSLGHIFSYAQLLCNRPAPGSSVQEGDKLASRLPPTPSPSGTLACLPLELLQRIFTLACTDGGRTACALAAVSSTVRAASRIGRFHSVRLHAEPAAQIDKFLASLAAETAPAPTVHHLFLGLCWRLVRRLAPGSGPAVLRARLRELLARVAPGLRSLVLAHGEWVWVEGVYLPDVFRLRVPFPELRELTIIGHWRPAHGSGWPYPDDPYTHKQDGEGTRGPLFPRLKRLHLLNTTGEQLDLRRWAAHAPGLTHLRISNLVPEDFVRRRKELEDIMGKDIHHAHMINQAVD